jgi:hypothetical protein
MLTSPARLCRPCRLARPAHAAATASFSIQKGEIYRETDCLLEGSGFELLVPREIGVRTRSASLRFCLDGIALWWHVGPGLSPLGRFKPITKSYRARGAHFDENSLSSGH